MNKKNKIGIILGTLGLVTITIATPLMVTSCNDNNNNPSGNTTNPIKPVEVPSTDNITTFADALEFTKQFFAKNYTFDMFKNDLKNMEEEQNKLMNTGMPSGFTMNFSLSASLDTNKKLNLSSTIVQKSEQNSSNNATIKSNKFNFKIVPILVKQSDGSVIAKMGLDGNWMGIFQGDQMQYNSLEELKQKEPNWENQTVSQFIRDFNGQKSEQWVIEDTLVDNSKLITTDQGWLNCQSIKLVFNNIENQGE